MKKEIAITQNKNRVYEAILEYFKKAFVDGTLKSGDQLLSERELALQFKVSRASLREALRALEMLGMLSVVPGKGTFILPPNAHSLAKVFGMAVSLRPMIYESILELRKIIQCGAVRLACKRATPEDLAFIKSSLSNVCFVEWRQFGVVCCASRFRISWRYRKGHA
jgi:GntR family transcriptional repressor for pyruvate dehydrogenase complex